MDNTTMMNCRRKIYLAATAVIMCSFAVGAQSTSPGDAKPASAQATPASGGSSSTPPTASKDEAARVVVPPNYVIGPDDVLNVVFWRDQDMTREVTVRPDGKISLPVVNDLQASGLTPDQLRESIAKASARLYTDEPTVSIVVKQINSRKVYITGGISKPGAYPLIGPMTIAQLIALAGGLLEYADQENISVVSSDKQKDGTPFRYKFDYKKFLKGENLKQNIELKPGDTVIIPL